MRFGLVHRVMTNALAALGVLAVVSSGELGRWVNVSLLVGLVLALLVPEHWHNKGWLNRLASFGPVVLLVVQIVRCWVFKRPLLDVAVEFAIVLQLVRLATRRGAAHDQQVIVLALIHLIAGTVLGSGLGYGLCFLGFLFVAPGALVLSHLRREVEGNYRQGARDRTGLPVDVPRILRSRRVVGRTFLLVTSSLAIPMLLFTGVLFLAFPRVGLSLLLLRSSGGPTVIGFSDTINLGKVGELRENRAIALYAEIPDLPSPPPERVTLYLRGTALDTISLEGKWTRTSVDRFPAPEIRPAGGPRQFLIERPADLANDRLFKFDLEHFQPSVIFIPPNASSLVARSRAEAALLGGQLRIERGSEGEFRYASSEERGLHYEIWVSRAPLPHPSRLTPDAFRRYTALPPFPARIGELARQWTEGKVTPLDKARAIEQQLRSQFRYDTATSSGRAASPLDHFLFESRRGHCEFFSTAMAVMLRQVGVPSRNVTGYLGGEYNRFSRNYVVRQRDAHAWVEAFIEGQGWVIFDPTPPAGAVPPSEMRGAFALIRDVLDALGQRWDRSIVHYDLNKQMELFEAARHRFDRLGLQLPARVRWWSLLAVASIALGLAWFVSLVRRWRGVRRGREPSESERAQAVGLITALYEQLDAAMAQQGLGRPQGMPPLKHAESSAVRSHALGEEIMALTRLYLDVRFGGATFGDRQRGDIEQRIKAIRAYRAR